MTGRFTSRLFIVGVLCVFSGYVSGESGEEALAVTQCAAEPDGSYFSSVASKSSNTSEICFVRANEVIDAIDKFQIVDVAAGPARRFSQFDSIRLPSWQIKSTSSLRHKPLLILAEPYKRHAMANLCSELIQSGFHNPKILLDYLPTDEKINSIELVSAEDFIVEVSNFGAVVIALEQKVATDLRSLGLPTLLAEAGRDLKSQLGAARSYSLNGYLPVFLVGDAHAGDRLSDLNAEEAVGPIFIVSGGIESIKSALTASALNAIQRSSVGKVSSCVR